MVWRLGAIVHTLMFRKPSETQRNTFNKRVGKWSEETQSD
jgi:hypothetical protein